MTSINITPKTALIDDPLKIEICGLNSKDEVTLFATLKENRMLFISSACFIADNNGQIDVSQSASLSGTYTGVHPTGILWSMVQAPGQRQGLRLVKKDVTTPYTISLSVHRRHITTEQCLQDENTTATSEFWRFYKDKRVTRARVHHGRIRGSLFLPPGRGPHPGVIDIFGSAGGTMEHRAALLASRGFATLALPYFNYEDLPDTIYDVSLDYFAEAVEWFSGLPVVAGKEIGISSVSFGSDITLQLSTLLPNIKACVCTGATYFHSFATMYYKDLVIRADPNGFDGSLATFSDKGMIMRDCLNWNPGEETIFKIEKSNAEFLFIHGTEDQNVHPRNIDKLVDRLKAHHKSNYTAVVYPGAGHLIEPPHAPLCYACYHRMLDTNIVYGGRPLQHAIAQEDSWKKIINFFKVHLPPCVATMDRKHKL